MGAKSGIKWNAVSEVQTQNTIETIGSDVQIILRDPRTGQEWVTSSVDYINALVALGVISNSGGSGFWSQSGGNLYPTTLTNNVGIGTASPSELLYVDGTVGTTSSIFKVQKNSLFDNVGFRYTGNNDAEGSLVDFLVGGLYGIGYTHELGSDYSIFEARTNVVNQWRSNGHISFQSDTGDGNVGIGTTTPTSLLTVDDGDIEITNKNKGLIVYSQDGTAWRVSVSDLGVVTATAV